MIKEFRYFLRRIDESLEVQEIEQSEISISANDYLETWECTLKNIFRNIKTGEIKRLDEIFKISNHYKNKYIGVYDKDGNFKVLNLAHKWSRDKFADVKVTFKNINYKNSREYYDIFVGPENEIIKQKEHGKGKYFKIRNKNRIMIEKQRFIVCNLYKYFQDIRYKFSGRRVEVFSKDLWHGDEGRLNFRFPKIQLYDNGDDMYDNGKLHIEHSYDKYFFFEVIDIGRGSISHRVDVFEPIVAKKSYRFINPIEDPYGEEDWGEYASEKITFHND
jgi:hypothetical protein